MRCDETLGAAPVCANCGAALHGRFCATCGQDVRPRLTLGRMLRDVLRGLTNVDAGFDRTVIDLLRRPGRVVRDYIGGRTVPYVGPVQFALLAAAAAVIVMLLLDIFDAERYTVIGFSFGGEIDHEARAANEFYLRFQNAFLLLAIPIGALATRVVFRRERLTYGEHLVFLAFVFGEATLLGTVLTVPVFLAIADDTAARLAVVRLWLAGGLAYFLWAALDFFRGAVARTLLGALAVALAGGLLYGLVTFAIVLGYAWLRTLGPS